MLTSLLGDQPFVSADVIDRLIKAFTSTRSAIVRPVVDGRPTTPTLMSASLFGEIARQRGDVGGREIVERHADDVRLVPVAEPRLAVDVDHAEDYEAAKGRA